MTYSDKLFDILWQSLKDIMELGTSPLNAMLDQVRKELERAHGNGIIVLLLDNVVVALRVVRDDDLGVGLGAERAGLEERLLEEHAARVGVATRVHVVESVAHAVERVPEGRVEGVLGLGAHLDLVARNVHGRVHALGGGGGTHRLGMADVLGAEEELTVEVRDLDAVIVGDMELTAVGAEAHERKALEVLAAERTGADHEPALLAELLLVGTAKDGDLVVVAAADRRRVLGHRVARHGELVEVEPLVQRRVLARLFDNLLRGNAAQEGAVARQLDGGVERRLDDDHAVNLLDYEAVARLLVARQDALRNVGTRLGLGHVVERRQTAVLGLELPQRQQRKVQLLAAVRRVHELRVRVHEHHAKDRALGHGRHERARKRAERDALRLLDLRRKASGLVLVERRTARRAHDKVVGNELLVEVALLVGVLGVDTLDRERETLLVVGGIVVAQLGNLHLGEVHEVTVVETVRLVARDAHQDARALVVAAVHERLDDVDDRRLAIVVGDRVYALAIGRRVGVAHVREQERRDTERQRHDEQNRRRYHDHHAVLLDVERVVVTHVAPLLESRTRQNRRHDHDTEANQVAARDGALVSRHVRERVELRELLETHVGASLANVALLEPVVGAKVGDLHRLVVGDRHRTRAQESNVLGHLDTDTTHTDHQHVETRETLHGLDTDRADLA